MDEDERTYLQGAMDGWRRCGSAMMRVWLDGLTQGDVEMAKVLHPEGDEWRALEAREERDD